MLRHLSVVNGSFNIHIIAVVREWVDAGFEESANSSVFR